jgi:hypothetical protein
MLEIAVKVHGVGVEGVTTILVDGVIGVNTGASVFEHATKLIKPKEIKILFIFLIKKIILG